MVVARADVREGINVSYDVVGLGVWFQAVGMFALCFDNQVCKQSQFRTSWLEVLSLVIPCDNILQLDLILIIN